MVKRTTRFAAALGALVLFSAASAAAAPLGKNQRLGFILTSLRTAIYETKYLEECPAGSAIGNDEIWWKSLSPRDRDRLTDGGEKEPASRRTVAERRGPNQENVCWRPDVVKDPPMRTVQGAISFGENLDGRSDGRATPNTCAHKDFRAPNGEEGIDNQMYRLVGCIYGWRSDGYIESVADTERRDSTKGVWMIEVTPLDQAEMQRVKVDFFRVVDEMQKSADGSILPYASYRMDAAATFRLSVTGILNNGSLETEPFDFRFPFYGNRVSTDMYMRGARLKLKIAPDGGGADGHLVGYHDLENWWDYVRKMGYLVETAQFSCPALYQAAKDLADGYPDPETGACTALSTAYTVRMLPGFVIHANERPHEGIVAPTVKNLASDHAVDPVAALEAAAPIHPKIFTARLGPSGAVLADLNGRTIYSRDADRPCDDACAEKWRPVEASWATSPSDAWTHVKRADGTLQWAFRGQALFTCVADAKPNIATCEGDGWQAVSLAPQAAWPSWVTQQDTIIGRMFANERGHTLYVLLGKREEFEREICDAACIAKLWEPVTAVAGAAPVGDWTPKDWNGALVWHYRGAPVHTYALDEKPGQIGGHLFGGASVSTRHYWSALPPEIADLASPRLAP